MNHKKLRNFWLLWSCMLWALCASAQSPRTGSQAPDNKPATPTIKQGGSAWHIDFPLGFRVPTELDTLPYNYQIRNIPSLQSIAYATTGNVGGPGENQIYFERAPRADFFFTDALRPWIPTFDKQTFYNVYVPMTQLAYNTGGGKENKLDRLQAVFAGNVNRRIGIQAFTDYIYSKGSYENQAVKNFSFGFSGYYTGDRYEMQAFWQHYNSTNKENGGITDDLYITKPEELQGGVTTIQPKSIPTKLTGSHNRLIGSDFYMSHAYKIGFWEEEVVNDTLTRDIYVPLLKFIYSLDWQTGHHLFDNSNAQQNTNYWQNTYFNLSSTRDNTFYGSLRNTIGVSIVEGFKPWAKFGLAGYATLERLTYKQMTEAAVPNQDFNQSAEEDGGLTPLPDNFSYSPEDSQTTVWVGGEITKEKGEALKLRANANFAIAGAKIGDVDINGEVSSRLRLLGDTVEIAARGSFRNAVAPYLLDHFVSNHFAWDNSFGQTRTLRFSGELYIPWTRTRLSAGVENLQNYIYFNEASMPTQEGGSLQIVSASLNQRLSFGIWNWDNKVTWQKSSNSAVLPLPQLAIYSNMYLHFKAFKVLDLQIGVDCDFYTKYYAPDYQPATMAFRIQKEKEVGAYPLCNGYVMAKLYKVRFYVMWSHLNQGLFGGANYFSMPHYPINPRQFQMGLSIDFAN